MPSFVLEFQSGRSKDSSIYKSTCSRSFILQVQLICSYSYQWKEVLLFCFYMSILYIVNEGQDTLFKPVCLIRLGAGVAKTQTGSMHENLI